MNPKVHACRRLAGALIATAAVSEASPAAATLEAGSIGQTGDSAVELTEVLVTANRRSQPLQDVGASVDTLEGESLRDRGVTRTSDLQKLVPGFAASDTGVNIPAYSLRGIGLIDPSIAANSTVAISVDEVPLPYTAMTQGKILDIQRVEIVKGPQGTLYGLNATGGAINYIANGPDDTLSIGARAGFGRFDTKTGDFHLGGPLGEKIKARLAAGGTSAGAWQRNFTREDALGRVERASARLALGWQPIERLTLDINFNGWIDNSDSQATQIVAFRALVPANAPRVPDVFASPIPPATARAANWNPERNYSRNDDFHQLSLKGKYEFGDRLSLTSITAYSDFKSNAFNDRDGMVPADFEFATTASVESIYQELRTAGEPGELTWSLGGNYRKDQTRDLQETDVSRGTNTFIAGLKLNEVDFFNDQDVETYAFFADGEWRITPRVAAIAGARYTRDQRDFTGSTCDNGDGDTAAVFTALANGFRTQRGMPAIPAIPAGQCVTLNPDTLEPGIVNDRLDEDNVAFRAQVNVRPADRSLIYASYSRGFKAGSFSTLSAVFAPVYGPATQERVDAIEVGFNSTLGDRRFRFHGAAFYYDYHDKQFRGRVLDPVLGSLQKLVNVPRSRIQGFELDLAAAPWRGVTLRSTVSYLDTEVKEFVGINLFGQVEDFAGQTLPYTPPWSVNLAGEYAWRLGVSTNAFAGADLGYRSRTSGFLGRDRPVDIRSHATLDLRAGVDFKDGRWRATIWGNNVTDAYYHTSAMRVGDSVNAYAARPATYGILLSFRN